MGRFDGIQVGEQVMRQQTIVYHQGGVHQGHPEYYLITDVWFDPCKGQHSTPKGEMVAIQQIGSRTGDLTGNKCAHTRRGLASNGYQPADRDFMKFVKDRLEAYHEGKVIGIGNHRKK